MIGCLKRGMDATLQYYNSVQVIPTLISEISKIKLKEIQVKCICCLSSFKIPTKKDGSLLRVVPLKTYLGFFPS